MRLRPITELREIKPTDVLEKDILKLVGDRKKIPTILALQFPLDTRYIDIEGAVKAIEKVKGVEGVTANLDWIKKRHSLREAIAPRHVCFRGASCNAGLPADLPELTQALCVLTQRKRAAFEVGRERLGRSAVRR